MPPNILSEHVLRVEISAILIKKKFQRHCLIHDQFLEFHRKPTVVLVSVPDLAHLYLIKLYQV